MTAEAAAAPNPPRYGMAVFTAILGLLSSFGPLSIDMYLPSLPHLVQELGTTPARVQFTLGAFLIGFGAGQLVYGPLADRFGRKPPLVGGILLYIAASIGCTQAESIDALIGWRFLQSLGGCAGMVMSRAIIRDVFGRDRSARIMSMMMLVMGAAPMLAPLVGAQVMLAVDWRAIFWVLAGFGLLTLAATLVGLSESLPPAQRRRVGASEMLSGYLHLVKQRRYLGYVFSSGLLFAGLFTYISGSPFVFIEVYGVPPERYGLLFGMNIVGMMIGSALNGRLVMRLGSDRLLRLGITGSTLAGLALAAVAATGIGGLPLLLLPLFCFIAGLSFTGPNAMAGALARYPHMAGTAAALAGTLQFVLGAGAGAVTGLLHDGTALPMAGVIGFLGALAFVVHRACVPREG